MKKIIIIAALILSKSLSAQTIQFVGNPWTSDNIKSVKNYVISFAGNAYHTVNMQTEISRSIDKAYYLFADTSGKKLSIDIKRILINRDPNTGIPIDTLIGEVKITGYYPLLFKIYKQAFNIDANNGQIAKNGKAEPIKKKQGGSKLVTTFYRSDEDSGAWTIWTKIE
jgi:uncharacterized protein YdeI (BOF family)